MDDRRKRIKKYAFENEEGRTGEKKTKTIVLFQTKTGALKKALAWPGPLRI